MDTNKAKTSHARPRQAESGACLISLEVGVLEILDSLPFYVMLIDRNHRILLANRAVRNSLGAEPDQIVGHHCPQVVHGLESGEYPGCPLPKALETKGPVEVENYDEESKRWVRSAVYPTAARMPDGGEIFFHMIVDITDKKRSEQELRRSEEKYRLLLEGLIKSI